MKIKGASMHIPPASPASFKQNSPLDPIVLEFYQLWTAWYNNPTEQTGDQLLRFLQTPEVALYFAQIAKEAPQPQPRVSFEKAYNVAIDYLTAWLNNGCPPGGVTPVSEFMSDVMQWIAYKTN
jgi:hypothetical protein